MKLPALKLVIPLSVLAATLLIVGASRAHSAVVWDGQGCSTPADDGAEAGARRLVRPA